MNIDRAIDKLRRQLDQFGEQELSKVENLLIDHGATGREVDNELSLLKHDLEASFEQVLRDVRAQLERDFVVCN